jgi:hypothetical protein
MARRKKTEQSKIISVDAEVVADKQAYISTRKNLRLESCMNLAKQRICETEEEYVDRFNWYFNWVIDNNTHPTVESFVLAMGWNSTAFFNRCLSGVKGDFLREMTLKARTIIQEYFTQSALVDSISTQVWQFYAKNYLNMTDKQTLDLVDNTSNSDSEKNELRILSELPL